LNAREREREREREISYIDSTALILLVVRIGDSRSAQMTRARTTLDVGSSRNIDPARLRSIEMALGTDRPDAAAAFAAVVSGHSDDANCLAA